MKLRSVVVAIVLLILTISLAGCADKAAPVPTAPTGVVSPSAAVTVSAGCYAVRFQAQAVYHFTDPMGVFHYTLSGDLEGTMVQTFDPAGMKYAGPPPFMSGGVNFFNGTSTWNITGGIVPGLTTFEADVAIHNLISDHQNSPATVFENIGTQRSTSGVTKANLSFKGTAVNDFAAGTQTLSHAYWGVICP